MMGLKRVSYVMVLPLGVLLVLSGAIPAQSGMTGGQMGQAGQATEPSCWGY
jgi:hypothetical protein